MTIHARAVVATVLVIFCVGIVPLGAQERPALAPRAQWDEGGPVLRYICDQNKGEAARYDVRYSGSGAEPAFTFFGVKMFWKARGPLSITPTHLHFEAPPDRAKETVDVSLANSQFRVERYGQLQVTTPSGKFNFNLERQNEPGTSDVECTDVETIVGDWLRLVLTDFHGAEAKFKQLTAGVTPPKPPPPTPNPIQPTAGDINAMVTPGSAQLYVDDEFRGTTSPEGHLVVRGLAAGAHTVRVNLPGYKVFEQKLDITGGQTAELHTILQRNGPDPFKEEEIEDGLQKGVTPARMKELVEQIGVGFTMNDDIEKRLRALGADDALLYAIVKNKR